jgi:capsular polysaccharide biosynthesis protein
MKMIRITIDHRSGRRLRRRLKSFVLRFVHQLKYPYPPPKKAGLLAQADSAKIRLLYRSDIARSQQFDHDIFARMLGMKNLSFSTVFVAELQDGRVYGKKGDVITADGWVLTDVNPEMSQSRDRHSLTERGNMPEPERIRGTVAVLATSCYYNYFHWKFDALSRIRFFEEAGAEIDYYYTDCDKPFQQDLLDLMDIPPEKIIRAQKDSHIIAERLLVSSLPGDQVRQNYRSFKDADTYRFIRSRVLEKVTLPNNPPEPVILYISRKGKRVLENEKQLISALQQLVPMEVICLEDLSVAEQARLFGQARLVIGMHGAGLANLVYCRIGCSVIEIHNPFYVNPLYFQISRLMQLHYYAVLGEKPYALLHQKNDVRGNVRVNVREVIKHVENCLAGEYQSSYGQQ